MTTPRSPVEFTDEQNRRAGNRVVLASVDGVPVGNQVVIVDNTSNQTGITNNPLVIEVGPLLGAAADVNAPAANTAAVVTYGAAAGNRHIISGIGWSYYGGVPTGGNLAVTEGANTIFSLDVPEEGPGFIEFPRPKSGAIGAAMVVTLTAGGAGITGKVSVLNHWTETV